MKKISMVKLSTVIIEKRKQFGMTQEELQDLTKINRQIIGRIEKGEHIPSIIQIEALMDALSFSFEDIIENDTTNNVFVAMRGQAKNDSEKEGVERLLSMMLFLKKQMAIRRCLGNDEI